MLVCSLSSKQTTFAGFIDAGTIARDMGTDARYARPADKAASFGLRNGTAAQAGRSAPTGNSRDRFSDGRDGALATVGLSATATCLLFTIRH